MKGNGDRYGLLENPLVRKLDELPKGWKAMEGTLTEPSGWRWACNGMSIGSGKREKALVREDGLR